MRYKLTSQYPRSMEVNMKEEFDELNEAIVFIKNKMSADAVLRTKVFYRIYENMDLIKEFDPDVENIEVSTRGGKSESVSFSPTPYNTAPRPAGVPHSSFVKNKNEKKDDKEK